MRNLYQRNVYSAGNYQLMDEESTKGMVISPGITSSWTTNTLGIPPVITSSLTRNPSEEGDSAGNH
jgi:hypothetical protein